MGFNMDLLGRVGLEVQFVVGGGAVVLALSGGGLRRMVSAGEVPGFGHKGL